jgi:hypothetical protein
MRSLSGPQDKLPDERLDHGLNLFQSTSQRSRRNLQMMALQFAHDPLERLLKLKLLEQHLFPETDRKEPFGDQLGGLGRRDNPSAGRAITTGAVAMADMPVAHQTDLPFNLLAFLGQAGFRSDFAADPAGALMVWDRVMGDLLR